MHFVGFDRIADNCDILIYINKFLNFSDQLRLSRVNVQLMGVFERFIWKEKYHTMTVTEDDGDYVVTGGIGTSPLIIGHEEFQEFLEAYADNIMELTVKDLIGLEIVDVMIGHFQNLTKVSYDHVQIPLTHFTQLAKKCPKLEELELCRCSIGPNSCLRLGVMPSVKSLTKFTKLKRLCVDDDFLGVVPHEYFVQAVKRLELESFKVTAIVAQPEKSPKKKRSEVRLKELDIQMTLDNHVYPKLSFQSYLTNFRNLLALTIRVRDSSATDAYLAAIAQTCSKLQQLTFHDTRFEITKLFAVPATVTELSLQHCTDLTYDHLRQLLTELKITKFHSKDTRYTGVLEDFQISPHIQCLDVEGVNTANFKSANIKELTWYADYGFQGFEAATVATDVMPLAPFLDLEKLSIHSGCIPMANLLRLNSLHTLNISESMPCISWSYVRAVLRHPSLRDLTISGQLYRSLLCERSDVPVEDSIHTNIQVLKISFALFQGALPYWLDVFRCNGNLKLICYNFKNFEEFLRTLIDDDQHFPMHLRTIEIWGLPINCSKLRRHFDFTMDKFIRDVMYLRTEYDDNEELYRLILCRDL